MYFIDLSETSQKKAIEEYIKGYWTRNIKKGAYIRRDIVKSLLSRKEWQYDIYGKAL